MINDKYSSTPADESKIIAVTVKQTLIPQKVCNLDYLMKVTHGKKEKINDILAVFLEETPEELSALTAAIEKTNYAVICNILHNIKTSFSILGISTLSPLLNEMKYLGSLASGIKKIKQLNRKVNLVFRLAEEEMKRILLNV